MKVQRKNEGSIFVEESAYINQKAQFGPVMF